LGIGADIAGSIRTPANFNGVYGLCSTYGRFPCHSARNPTLGLINGVARRISASIDTLELYARYILSLESWNWDATCLPMPWNEQASSDIDTWQVRASSALVSPLMMALCARTR